MFFFALLLLTTSVVLQNDVLFVSASHSPLGFNVGHDDINNDNNELFTAPTSPTTTTTTTTTATGSTTATTVTGSSSTTTATTTSSSENVKDVVGMAVIRLFYVTKEMSNDQLNLYQTLLQEILSSTPLYHYNQNNNNNSKVNNMTINVQEQQLIVIPNNNNNNTNDMKYYALDTLIQMDAFIGSSITNHGRNLLPEDDDEDEKEQQQEVENDDTFMSHIVQNQFTLLITLGSLDDVYFKDVDYMQVLSANDYGILLPKLPISANTNQQHQGTSSITTGETDDTTTTNSKKRFNHLINSISCIVAFLATLILLIWCFISRTIQKEQKKHAKESFDHFRNGLQGTGYYTRASTQRLLNLLNSTSNHNTNNTNNKKDHHDCDNTTSITSTTGTNSHLSTNKFGNDIHVSVTDDKHLFTIDEDSNHNKNNNYCMNDDNDDLDNVSICCKDLQPPSDCPNMNNNHADSMTIFSPPLATSTFIKTASTNTSDHGIGTSNNAISTSIHNNANNITTTDDNDDEDYKRLVRNLNGSNIIFHDSSIATTLSYHTSHHNNNKASLITKNYTNTSNINNNHNAINTNDKESISYVIYNNPESVRQIT